MMRVLVACEESQRVCIAFRSKGHEAYSCDIQDESGGHPEWHIKGDCLKILNGHCEFITQDGKSHYIPDKWDMIIAHPPCTYLSNAGARHLYPQHILNQCRYKQGIEAKEFFMKFVDAECDKICVENPIPSKIFELPKYTQIIQPYEHGNPYKKKTALWLKNLPPLKPTNYISPQLCESTKKAGNWYNTGGKDRQKNRAKTFIGIAKAMSEQWG